MNSSKLQVEFTDQQLEALYQTGASVVLGMSPDPGQQPLVVWQVFSPFNNNLIEWAASYGLYFSATPCTAGQTVILNDMVVAATAGIWYTLGPAGYIRSGGTAPASACYYLRNQYALLPVMTGGLLRSATINGQAMPANCLTATAAMTQGSLILQPSASVCIWVQPNIAANTITGEIPSPVTFLSFEDKDLLVVAYDTGTGRFIPVDR